MRQAIGIIEKLPLMQEQPVLRYGVALAACAVAVVLRWLLSDYLPPGYPFVTFFPAVILSSFLFGTRTGIFAGVVCGIAAWFLFIPPRATFDISEASMVAMAFYVGVIAVDILLIHWLQSGNARLLAAREESGRLTEESQRYAERAEVLFQELQHRVGNNLQMVGAVLSLQMRGLKEPSARHALADAASRLQVLGSIQRQLYRPDGELMPLDAFLSQVCEQFMRSNGRPGITCQVNAGSGLVLPPTAALPMALILSEALANALEHAFDIEGEGTITVSVQQTEKSVELTVADDGRGIPQDLDTVRTDSLGLRISRALARQLGARYSLQRADRGSVMRLAMPAERFAAGR